MKLFCVLKGVIVKDIFFNLMFIILLFSCYVFCILKIRDVKVLLFLNVNWLFKILILVCLFLFK